MDPSQRLRLLELYGEAEPLSEAERAQFCRARSGDDPEVQRELESLLLVDHSRAAFLDAPLLMSAPSPDALALDDDREEELGELGPFQLHEVLGEGGMGTVYRATQREPVRREVALKVIRRGLDSARVARRFDAERHALARMEHPGIARIYEAGATPTGKPWFALELVAGPDLLTYCRAQELDVDARVRLLADVCDAVQHAHQKGVLHRDLKPSNILVASGQGGPRPKIIDFGIARATAEPLVDHTLTRIDEVVGTLDYMSPEQLAREDDIDSRSDIYSLGVILYELLTGRHPHDGHALATKSATEIQRVLREHPPVAPSRRVAATSSIVPTRRSARLQRRLRGDLDAIALTALAYERDRRYASASEMAADLRRFLRNAPVLASTPSLGYRLGKYVRRNRGTIAAVGFVLISVTAGAAVATHYALVAGRESRDRARALDLATGRMERLYHALELWQIRSIAANETMPLILELRDLRAALVDVTAPGVGTEFEELIWMWPLLPHERVEQHVALGDRLLGAQSESRVASGRTALAGLLVECGLNLTIEAEPRLAERYLARAAALCAEVEPQDPLLVWTYTMWLDALIDSGRVSEAVALASRQLSKLAATGFADDEGAVAVLRGRRAAGLIELGDLDAAAAELARAEPTLERIYVGSYCWIQGLATRARLAEARGSIEDAALARDRLALGRSRAQVYAHMPSVRRALGADGRTLWDALVALRQDVSRPTGAFDKRLAELRAAASAYGLVPGSPRGQLIGAVIAELATASGNRRNWSSGDVSELASEAEHWLAPRSEERTTALQDSALALAQVAFARGEDAEAERWARLSLDRGPASRSLHEERALLAKSVLGRSLVAQGRHADAEPYLLESYPGLAEEWGVRDGSASETLRALLHVLEERGSLHEAQQILTRKGVWRGDAPSLVALGEAQLEAGLVDSAVRSLRAALDVDPESEAARQGLERARASAAASAAPPPR